MFRESMDGYDEPKKPGGVMDVNGDFSRRVLLHSDEIDWEKSEMAGVDRRRLDRVDDGTVDRVTTVVRYAPKSSFSPHVHTGGEEFIVLEGVFQDEYGDFPAGSYIRNPPQSRHKPGSEPGCTILVKLCQFDPADRTFVRIDTNKLAAVPDRGRDGVAVMPLYRDAFENVRIEHWDANAAVTVDAVGGGEFFVLDGGCSVTGDDLRAGSWLRVPLQTEVQAIAGPSGCRVWIKTDHLSVIS